MSKLSLTPVLTALALLWAPPAFAAGPWSAPLTVTTGSPQLAEPTIAFGDDGRALLSARITSEAHGVPTRGFSRLFGQQADGGFTGRGRIVLAARPALYGRDRLALLRLPLAAGDLTIADLERPSSSLGASFGRIGDAREVEVGAYRRLTRRADRYTAAIAASDRGDVAAVWIEHLSGHDHLVAALARRHGPFGRPRVIAGSGFLSSPSVAWSDGGDLLVAYQRSIRRRGRLPDRRVEARVRRVGRQWSRPQRLGASSGFSDISTAAAPDGRMVVAWGTQDLGEEANRPWIVRAAVRPAASRAFSGQTLETSEGVERTTGDVVAAMAPDGAATVAWSAVAGARFPFTHPARVATASGSSVRFAAPQTLSANATVGDVTVDARGAAVVVWATLPDPEDYQTTDQVFASLRAAGAAAFAAPEAVGPAEGAALPRAAFDPRTHRPAAVWISVASDGVQGLRYATRTG